MSRVFNPVYSSTSDGSDITLCRILEAAGSIKDAIAGGGGGGATAANPAVGPDGVTRVPLNVNADGELKVNVEASVDADLAQIENKLDTLIGIATPQAADIASINTEALSIDNKLPALSGGKIPVVNDTPVTTATYGPQAGVIAINTILVGPLNVSQFRTISLQVASMGTTGQITAEISNDNATWTVISGQAAATTPSFLNTLNAAGTAYYQTFGANYFRLRLSVATTGGTTTLYVQGVKEVYPQNLQFVQVNGSSAVVPAPVTSQGFNTYHTLVSAASTNATSVKGSAGTIGTCVLTNVHNQFRYVKFFNLAVAPTMGTSTPVIQFPIAPSSTLDVSTAFAGLRFATGIAYAITHNAALLDNTPVNAGEVLVNLSYV
jgi:hypothetical protein